MSTAPNPNPSRETGRLLAELDQAINRSSIMRDIIGRYERLRRIENITGPSRLTRDMRSEIRTMEIRLRRLRSNRLLPANNTTSPG